MHILCTVLHTIIVLFNSSLIIILSIILILILSGVLILIFILFFLPAPCLHYFVTTFTIFHPYCLFMHYCKLTFIHVYINKI